VLDRCLTASKAIGDRSVEAWVLHQLGTRSVYLGDADAARRALDQAARLRDELGETAAASVSRRNLSFIVAKLPVDVRRERAPRPFDDVGGDDPAPVHRPAPARRSRWSMREAAALIITFLLFAALGGFVYVAIAARESVTPEPDRRADQTPPSGLPIGAPAPPATSEASPATSADAASPQRASIRIFTARPGSITTRRPTDLCYAVSDAVRTRIEPTLGDVDAADTLTCRTVTPRRTTTYELTAVGRDGIPVSEHLVIVVR
jgi:hypothetical protein